MGSDWPGSVLGSDWPGSVLGSDWPGSVLGSDWPGSVLGSDWPGSVLGSDWPSSVLGSDWPSSVLGSDWPSSVLGSDWPSSGRALAALQYTAQMSSVKSLDHGQYFDISSNRLNLEVRRRIILRQRTRCYHNSTVHCAVPAKLLSNHQSPSLNSSMCQYFSSVS